ncbi:HEAT repeat domain-containing protein [Massilia sp. BJB1822]|uniref:HEAT repeat domain-containing protein n=1 Tax=Massilia sp. BJB1822 TaxID=2744470 RepID=UPI001594AD36|nr:HEAT repeat domain-containing protein [Massilia sp. BJB1822]NVD97470.1 HEAT repeat domain-containing protein [Massilia sp. BJB1822]
MSILSILAEVAASRDADELSETVCAVNRDFSTAPLLAHILLEDWHRSHENIVFELGLIGNPSVVDAIASAARTKFKSLVEWDRWCRFQRECAFALARIGTNESRAALEEMVRSEDAHLRQVGEEGLSYWPMPYGVY